MAVADDDQHLPAESKCMSAMDLILALNGSPSDFYVAMDVGGDVTYPVRVTKVDVQHRTIFIAP